MRSNIPWWARVGIAKLLIGYGLRELKLWLMSLAIIVVRISIWPIRSTYLQSWVIWWLNVVCAVEMIVRSPQVLIHLVSAVSLWWQRDIVTLITLYSIGKASVLPLDLLLSLKVVGWLVMLHLWLMHILSSRIGMLFSHIALPIILVWLVASLLLRWAHSWNGLDLPAAGAAAVLLTMVVSALTINRWHHRRWSTSSLPCHTIVLSRLSSLGSGVALSTILAILLVRFVFANFSHLAVCFRRTLLVIWMRIVVVYFLFSLHEPQKFISFFFVNTINMKL